ncbi:MAG TPA: SgcJ/EcaC family oxidoreductase [Gemmatimonadaceae bacterium]|nr:SgcJ/EcaC family oxidoreductase [Gemmatimonadaceae bacterium]
MTNSDGAAKQTIRAESPSTFTAGKHLRAIGAMAGVALLVGCGGGSNKANGPTSPTSPNASLADAFDHVGPQQGDEAGVAAVVTAWDAAWNAGDAAGLAATFVEDAEFINAMGRLFVGAEAIRAQHAITLAAQFRGSHTEGHIRRITFLSGTTAVLDVDNNLTRYEPDGPGSTTMKAIQQSGRHKRILVKRAGVWRTMFFQNTMVTATP